MIYNKTINGGYTKSVESEFILNPDGAKTHLSSSIICYNENGEMVRSEENICNKYAKQTETIITHETFNNGCSVEIINRVSDTNSTVSSTLYDDSGRIISESYNGTTVRKMKYSMSESFTGEPIINNVKTYNNKGELISVKVFNDDGTIKFKRFFTTDTLYAYYYDDNKNCIKMVSNGDEGYICKYNDKNKCIYKSMIFDNDEIHYQYNKDGRLIREIRYVDDEVFFDKSVRYDEYVNLIEIKEDYVTNSHIIKICNFRNL